MNGAQIGRRKRKGCEAIISHVPSPTEQDRPWRPRRRPARADRQACAGVPLGLGLRGSEFAARRPPDHPNPGAAHEDGKCRPQKSFVKANACFPPPIATACRTMSACLTFDFLYSATRPSKKLVLVSTEIWFIHGNGLVAW